MEEKNLENLDDTSVRTGMSRRQFVRDVGIAATALGAFGAAGAMTGCSPGEQSPSNSAGADETGDEIDIASADGLIPNTSTDTTYIPQLTELPRPETPAPETTEYDVDILVVGGGLTGLNAAYAAAQAGKNVVLADKGTPGYSGLSAWPSCTAFYDPDRDADMETWDKSMYLSCENFANLNWEDVWCEESKDAFDRLTDWGWISQYETGLNTEYFVDGLMWHDDVKGYFREFEDKDRRKVFMKVLEEAGVTVCTHTMIMDFVENDGQCVGAVGLHFKSSTPITFKAKAVILCTGNGVTKSTGYPVGADTYDGVWMGYSHGLPITGMEFEDFHTTSTFGSGNAFLTNSWAYLENIWPTGGTVDADNLLKRAGVNKRFSSFLEGYAKSDNTLMDGQTEGEASSVASQNGDEDDPRKGKWNSPHPKGEVYGGATGMSVHTAAGVWCGIEDTWGDRVFQGCTLLVMAPMGAMWVVRTTAVSVDQRQPL